MLIQWCRLANTEGFMQFSKEPTSQNFGDLPRGEIPEPLKFNRPYRKYSTFLLYYASHRWRVALWTRSSPNQSIYYNLLL